MKFHVFKTLTGLWRFTNLRNIGGDRDTFEEAFAEAYDLAKTLTPGPIA